MISSDTIAAVSTPPGPGAIAVLRVSGPDARGVLSAYWRGPALDVPRRAVFGQLVDEAGEPVDQVVVTWFRGPRSFTGEDVVEISCHGGVLVTRRILELLCRAGARLAGPGEFTQRAFLNGKIDLTQAEAVMDVITARTTLALRAASEQLEGRLGRRTRELREEIIGLLANVEAWLDFPDEDIEPLTGGGLEERLEGVRDDIDALLATAAHGRILREGVDTVITGAPNVGKSSLLNRLLDSDRAIVSEWPGTTRDTIEEMASIGGLPIRLIDTAGLRETTDPLEHEGMARSRRALDVAELVLDIAEAPRPREDYQPATTPARRVVVLNKIDLGEHPSWQGIEAVRLSCRTGQGIEALTRRISAELAGETGSMAGERVAINARHKVSLEKARVAIESARSLLRSRRPPELVAEELRVALGAVGEMTGAVDAEEVLGAIFGRFCIGK